MEDVLLIDDDVELCSMLTEYLGKNGFRVKTVHRGDTGLRAAQQRPWALILLDVMLPGMDGFEVLKRIRAESYVSVLLLTARGEDVDRIVGLEIGADDYLPKPFNPRELLARMRAVLRRQDRTVRSARSSVCAFRISNWISAARKALKAGKKLDLTDVEFGLSGGPDAVAGQGGQSRRTIAVRAGPYIRSIRSQP